jgi:endonuclease YncB( thermonuclease family)
MQSESRLERKTLYRDNQVSKDYQDTSKNDTLYNTINLGVAAIAGYGLLKTGALKPVVKPLLELADKVAREGSDKAAVTMKTVKQWAHLRQISPSQRDVSKVQSHIPPKTSIFRDRDSSLAYDIYDDLTHLSKDRQTNFHNMRELMSGTVQDIQLLAKMIQENQANVSKQHTNFLNTDIYNYMREYSNMRRDLLHNGTYAETIMFSDKGMEEFIKKMSLTAQEAAQELRESGYKKLTWGDITEIIEEDGVHKLVMKQDAKIDLNTFTNERGESLLDIANKFFKENRYGGNKTVLSTGAWKDIIIDSSMRVDKEGNIIDYRMSRDDLIAFSHSLATDFGLPLVKFNPAKMLGLDKLGRRPPLMGILGPGQYSPNITHKAGRISISEWLGEEFGESYKNKNVAVINGTAYILDENNKLQEIGNNLKLHDITNADRHQGLKPMHNAQRQMAGLSTGEAPDLTPEEIANLTPFQRFKYKTGEILDLGRHEIRPESDSDEGFDTLTNLGVFQDNIISKIGDSKLFRVNGFDYSSVQDYIDSIDRFNFKTLHGQGLEEYSLNGRRIKPRMYEVTKEGFKISEAISKFQAGDKSGAAQEMEGFVKQFFVGQNEDGTMHEFFTERSGWLHSILNQLNEGLAGSSRLLGLSVDSKKSSLDLGKNLLLKRALPVYLLTKVPEMINYYSEPFFGGQDETGNRDNITKFLMRDVVKPIDIGAHHAMDLIGATKVFKFLGEMIPGSDQINELPGIYQLGLGQTGEEREEYIENGYDPMRKGRWWDSGNTPFTGGKIMYFRPNIYRRVEADVEFSDSKWGSRQEYYNNTWFPNPINPLAPINYFLLDRNHYDKKHYYDRPYLQTAPVGQNIPIIGPLFGSTIGTVISPPTKMHLEYWQNGFAINPEDEKPSTLLTEGKIYDNSATDLGTYNRMQQQAAISNANYQNALYTSAYHAKQVVSKGYIEKSGITFEQRNILPERTYDRYNTPYEVYSTPSGALNVVDVPDEMNLYNVNKDLQQYSINKVLGTNQRVERIDQFQGPGIPVGNDNPSIDNAFVYGLGEQFNTLADVAGLKGFALQAFVTGEANERARVIEDSGYAYSFNNDFWEANLGGLGGGLSEITRRFIPKRNNKTEYVNPIRNTMPSWMPGSDYFTDFKHGDPYSKIDNGEERLPGEGYERLHNIKGLMEFNIGSSSIGYEKDYIIKHMLKADKYMSTFERETLKKGDEIHKEIEKSWLEAGLAINIEGKVEDKRNGIIGWYDAMVHDISSPTGVAIVDIKSTSAKKLEELRKSGKPLTHHMRQTNYYLWATGNMNSKGYIHYVDKEDPTNTYTVGFDYSQKELETTLNNVFEARKTIRKAVETGEIGRGELYSTIDRFRILADVAPYSQEFKDVSAQLSMEDLSPEEQEEASQIRERVAQQKEPLRVYDYKFKTANLKTETVTVSKVIDNNTIVTKEYGKQHSIKFAGINVSMSNSEKYDDKRTMDEAAGDAIRKRIRPGSRIQISYDADERNKYSKDSTGSIRAVVHAGGTNMNRYLLAHGHAKEKEDDNSPAAIRARYSKGEIAFGSAMETLTHSVIGNIPFVGSKLMQVRSPYEQYRKREVYGKDFQSWNHPIRDIAIPHIQENIANNEAMGLGGIIAGGFIGSLFGKNPFGKIVGTVVGATIPAIGKIAFALGSDSERDWRPKRRREQEKLNEYVDTLKYVKNMRLYEQYKTKTKKEDNFDVESFMNSKEAGGVKNKLRQQELTDYKKKVKLDFKHRDRYNFKYGDPKYTKKSMSKKETISAINREISELQGQRKVTKIPVNAMKAIEYKQAAEQTMYAYKPGDSLVNIMKALPKKDRQYFKHFMNAPEEEKGKILRIAPSYLRRALQSTWGMPVDKKPSLDEYFRTHGLPDASWVGWNENTNIEDVKVKLVHQNKLDPGEFDIWDSNKIQADQTNIPIPKINAHNDAREVQIKLSQILGKAGYENVQMSFIQSSSGNKTSLNIKRDARGEVAQQIEELEV